MPGQLWFVLLFAALLTGAVWSQGQQQPSSPAPSASPPDSSQQNPADEQLLTLRRQVNFVEVPVTITDEKRDLVFGLEKQDFQVFENGEEQVLTYFSATPMPLSIAVLVDLGMPDIEITKVQETLTALVGSFSAFDEVAVYQFSNTVWRMSEFSTVGEFTGYPLRDTLQKLARMTGATGGVGVRSGPFHSDQPINDVPGNPASVTRPATPAPDGPVGPRKPSRVLNDALLMAIGDLAKRPRERGKILFVLSDGTEFGSDARDDQVLRALLSYPISVFGIGIGEAALPVYKQAGRARISTENIGGVLPSLGLGHALPKYAKASGGDVFPAYEQQAIERAYSQASEQARYRYTLGYNSQRMASGFRSIAVRVNRPGVRVLAREGYYPTAAAQ